MPAILKICFSSPKSAGSSGSAGSTAGFSLPLVLVILMVSLIPAGIFMVRLDQDVSKQIEKRGQRDAEMYLRSRLSWLTYLINEGSVAVNCSGKFWFPGQSAHSAADKTRLEIELGRTFFQSEDSLSLRLCIYPASQSVAQLGALLNQGQSLSPMATDCMGIGGSPVPVTITPLVRVAAGASGEKTFSLEARATVPVGYNNQTKTWKLRAVTLVQALPQVCMTAGGTLGVSMAAACPSSGPAATQGWGLKGLILAGAVSGKCANGIFSADSIDISGSGGTATDENCAWSYPAAVSKFQADIGTSSPNILASFSNSSASGSPASSDIMVSGFSQAWESGKYSASGNAVARFPGKLTAQTAEVMNINMTYSGACKSQ